MPSPIEDRREFVALPNRYDVRYLTQIIRTRFGMLADRRHSEHCGETQT
jgi:hypothetical protein